MEEGVLQADDRHPPQELGNIVLHQVQRAAAGKLPLLLIRGLLRQPLTNYETNRCKSILPRTGGEELE